MGLLDVIYDKEAGTIFTRTPQSWGKIGLFYLVYYSCLAAFFAGLLAVFLFSFTDDKAPLLTGSHSVLLPNPGMGFRPMPDETKKLIKFKKSDNSTYLPYIKDMMAFLDGKEEGKHATKPRPSYLKGQPDTDYADCKKTRPTEVSSNSKPCKFLIDDYPKIRKNCIDNNFGYEDGTPCIAVKLNKIFEFVPEIEGGLDYLQIKCEGEYPADKDNVGEVTYYPNDGYPLYFYPYLGQHGYVSPLVFVKLQNPKPGVLIQILCQPANVANIKQNKMFQGDGRITLEVLIDE